MDHPYRSVPRGLTPPPREVPRWLAARLLLDGTLRRLGWLWLAAVLTGLCWLGPRVHLRALSYPQMTTGRIDRVSVKSSGDDDGGDGPTFVVDASFVDRAGRLRRVSSISDWRPAIGRDITVDYDDARARIRNMDDGTIGLRGIGLFLLFLAPGMFMVMHGLGASWRDLRLLRTGAVTTGRLVEKAQGRVSINNVPESVLTFEFEIPSGRAHRCTVHTFDPARLEDQHREPVLYDPRWPDHATTLDHLPGSPRIDDRGRIHATVARWPVVLAPALAAALLVVGLVRLL